MTHILSYLLQASWSSEGISLSPAWPETGIIEFQDYGLQYRRGFEFALKGISLRIQERDKVQKEILPEIDVFIQYLINFPTRQITTQLYLILNVVFYLVRSVLWEELEPENHHLLLGFSAS